MCLSCQQHHTSYYELDKNQQGVISLDLVKLQTPRPHSACTLMALWPKTSLGVASLSSNVWLPSMKTVQPIWSQPPAWQWRWKQSPMPSSGMPQEVTVGPHMPSSSQIQWACYKKWKWNRKPTQECVNGQCPPSKTLWVYCPGHAGVKENDWAERLAVKQPSQVACFSEDLKCWEVWDSTCRHKTKDILPAGTKPRTFYLQAQNQGHHTCRHKTKDITPAGTKPRTSHHQLTTGERRGKRKF